MSDSGVSLDKGKKKRKRSPNFPAMNLERAIEKAKLLYDHSDVYKISEASAHKDVWSYAAYSSSGYQTTAALKAFGLIDVTGSGKQRSVKITESARRILLDSQGRDELMRKAALTPPIHREILEHFGGEVPPDGPLREFLLIERKFNKESVDTVIEEFRGTISFAKLTEGHILKADEPEEEEEDEQGGPEDMTPPPMINRPPKKDPPNMEQGQFEDIRFALPSGKAVLYLPANMRPEEFDILQTIIDAHKRVRQALAGKVKDESADNGQNSSS